MNIDFFVQNVKHLCEGRGISPTAACKESGVGTSFIPDIKRGRIPSIDKFEKLALYLGVTISQLIGDAQNSPVVLQYSVPPKDTIAEITKREEKSWKEYYAREARRRWVASPWGLVGTLEGIMQLQECTAGYKIKLMHWAMDAYNAARNETSVNPTDSGRHRTSCPEHTED